MNTPLTKPATADSALAALATSVARDPDTTKSGPQLAAPAMKRKTKLKNTLHLLVTSKKYKEVPDAAKARNTPR